MPEKTGLSKKTIGLIEEALAKFPEDRRKSAVISALTIVQDENGGSLTTELMDLVADYIQMPKIEVYEVATFYSMFELEPVGKHKICVCTSVSCMLNGCGKIVDYLEKKLDIGFGEITQDGKFSIKEVECLAACGGAPMVQIGSKYHENLTPEKIDKILADLE
jgi:NADH-quinone oxidoreductase subunit E